MTTTFAPSFSRTTVPVTSSSSAAPSPLTVLVHPSFEGTSDFFPFHDLAKVGGYTKDDFTFRDLIQDGIDGGPLVDLYLSGCHVPGGNRAPDCATACNDTALHFGSFETFYNCAALAAIAHWTGDVGTYYVGADAERNASVLMGGGTLAGFRARPVLESFAECAVESCTQDQLSAPCDASVMDLTRNSSSRDIFAAMDNFCPELRAEINPDIFGPGVLISYVLQVVFSGSLYLFLKIFTLWVGYSQKPTQRRPTSERLVRRLTRIESMLWKDSSALSRTSIAIATTLVEFQEAQCWFVFAVQIASILAIVVNSQEGTFWGEIVVNSAVAFHVSQNGILPMFLVQICLHNEGIRNWHTFLGFCTEYLLAIVATTQRVSFRGSVDLFRGQHAVAACGGNPSPRTYCASSAGVDGLTLTFFPHPLVYKLVFLVLDTIAIVALAFDQLAWTLRTHHRTRHWTLGAHGLGRWPDGPLKRHWVRLSAWFWHGLEFAYLVINILYLVSLSKVISDDSFQANRWSYGQIIAMTVWGPVIVKLFSLILSGPPKNGEGLNSGPPRLRIDNVLNHRQSDSVDDVMSTSSSARWMPPPPPQLPLQRKLAMPQRPDTDGGGMKETGEETAPPRTLTIRHE